MQLEEMKKRVSLVEYAQNSGFSIEKAGKNAYRINPCPRCGHKDHFTLYPDSNSYVSFSGCCKGGSIIDFLIEVEGLSPPEAIDKLKRLDNLTADDRLKVKNTGNTELQIQKQDDSDQANNRAGLSEKEMKEIALLVQKASLKKTAYYTDRGLTNKTIEKYRLGYLPAGHSYGAGFKYLLPVSDRFVIIRSDNEKDRYRNMGNTEILNECYLKDQNLAAKDIFITEGYFDALSIEELDYPAIGLNSTAMTNKLVDIIEENRDKLKDKRFILALDEDRGGKEGTAKITERLANLGISYAVIELDGYKDVNHYLIADRVGLKKKIESLPLKGTVYEYLQDTFELDQIKRISEPEINTGLPALDDTLGGGLYPGLYVLGAISSLGKTALALQMADRIAAQGHQVLFFSLEMGHYEMTCRSLARTLYERGSNREITTGHILKTIYKGRDIYADPLFQEALESYKEGPAMNITIKEGNFDLDINKLRTAVNEHVGRTGKKPVVFVDYLQVLKPLDLRMTEKQHIDLTIVELKRIGRDLDVPVIAVSSFNRANYKTDVGFEAFKESGAIEYTADVVLAMQLRKNGDDDINELKNREPRPLELVVLKNRRGRAYEVIGLDYWAKQNFFAET